MHDDFFGKSDHFIILKFISFIKFFILIYLKIIFFRIFNKINFFFFYFTKLIIFFIVNLNKISIKKNKKYLLFINVKKLIHFLIYTVRFSIIFRSSLNFYEIS